MPTTRRQAALKADESDGTLVVDADAQAPPSKTKPAPKKEKKAGASAAGQKREADEKAGTPSAEQAEPPAKKQKVEEETEDGKPAEQHEPTSEDDEDYAWRSGVIERGHIYFLYRPKVEHDEAHSLDDVQHFQLVLVPRPPAAAKPEAEARNDDGGMTLLQPGADAVPAREPRDQTAKHFRVISVGKKALPDPDHGGGPGRGRKDTFWAAVGTVGEDVRQLGEKLGAQEYETKTRGTRHVGAARLAGRGAYALVNTDGAVRSKRTTHLGYRLSHPAAPGAVQAALGIHTASSFVLQLRNPRAPAGGPPGQRVGLGSAQRAQMPDALLRGVFGRGERGTDASTGLRFASIPRADLFDYEGVELLFIADKAGTEGLEESLGEGRGEALEEAEMKESNESVEEVFSELALDIDQFPVEPLEGDWL